MTNWLILLVSLTSFFTASCNSCGSKVEEPTRVSSNALTLQMGSMLKETAPVSNKPNIKVINIGPSKEEVAKTTTNETPQTASDKDIPKEVAIDSSLTGRLKDKLAQAFEGKGAAPPDIEIYTGVMSLGSFAQYYEGKGYKIQRTSVPASQIIAPLLEEKPELSSKISLNNYAGITINQVIVEGLNISAADKYIDPLTYEVVYKTFVTVTKTK